MSRARLAQLQALADAADAELAAWLRAGVARWRTGERLDRALDLVGANATHARDAALLRAARLLDPERVLGDWALAVKLAKAIAWFEANEWPRLHALDRPPSHLSGALFDALTNGRPLRSARKLLPLLQAESERQRTRKRAQNMALLTGTKLGQ